MSSLPSKEGEPNGSAGNIADKSDSSTKESGGGGLFGVLKKTANVTTRRGRRLSSKNQPTSSEETMQQRKIVKAIKPPENSGDDSSPPSDDAKVVEDKDIDRDAKRYALPGNAPSVETETQQKLTEKTKKDRMDEAASVKKKQKAKALEEKRKAMAPTPTSSDVVEEGDQTASATVTQPKDKIFSVESERAESKRTTTSASLPVDPEPVEKKMKVGTLDEDGDDAEGKSSAKSWLGGTKLIALAAVVAVGAFVLMRVVKKK